MELVKRKFKYIMHWSVDYKGIILNVLVSSILVTFLGMNWPLVYRYVINKVFYEGSVKELKFILIIYCLLFFAEKLLQYIWKLSEAMLASKFIYNIKKEIYNKIFLLSLKEKNKYSSGEILDILNRDVEQIYTFLVDEGIFAFTSLVRLIMATLYVFLISKVASIVILMLVIINYFLSKYLKKRFTRYFLPYKKQLENYNSFMQDILSGLKEIKILSVGKLLGEKFQKMNYEMAELQKKQLVEEGYREIFSNILNIVTEIIIYSFVAVLVISNKMRLGDFVSLMIYYEWIKMFFAIFLSVFAGSSKSFASIERINSLMNMPEEEKEGKMFEGGNIEFRNVSFSYNCMETVLRKINLEIEQGSIIAIVGESGTGKSTLINILLKFYEPTDGNVYIGGEDLKEISLEALRSSIGVVSQNARLFEGTIKSNLLMGTENCLEEEIWEVLSIVHAKDFIEKLPQKLDSNINSLENLSTGQIQRLILARILLKKAEVIILDEATSNIDEETESAFLDEAIEVFSSKTVIMVAYRPRSLEIADKIYFLHQGQICDCGTHEELLMRNMEYRKLIGIKSNNT